MKNNKTALFGPIKDKNFVDSILRHGCASNGLYFYSKYELSSAAARPASAPFRSRQALSLYIYVADLDFGRSRRLFFYFLVLFPFIYMYIYFFLLCGQLMGHR